jgi:hypothetical protein
MQDYIGKSKEIESLKSIIEGLFNLSLTAPRRTRNVIDARIIYAKILRDRNHTLISIGKSINKDHSTVFNYIRQATAVLSQDKELDKKYKVVKDMFMDEQFPSRYFTDKDLVSHIIKLNEKVEKLSAKLYRYKRIKDIIELVDKRTPEGHEWTVEKKLIAMYNGLK